MRRLHRHRFLFARHFPRSYSFRGLGNVLVLREPIRALEIVYPVLVMARTVYFATFLNNRVDNLLRITLINLLTPKELNNREIIDGMHSIS